jgi:hypothetical protein
MRFAEFERRARQIFDEIPPELRTGVEYLQVSREAVPHPELPDVYTLGECATGELDVESVEGFRSGVHLYWGSFRELARLQDDFDWEEELWETITHEIRHHRESAAGEDDLEEMDYADDENFKRREGEPFDPFFFRAGEEEGPGRWRVDRDLFIEREVDARTTAPLEVDVDGETVRVPVPANAGDVHYLYLAELCDADADVALVLVRRRGAWASLVGALTGWKPEVVEEEVSVR